MFCAFRSSAANYCLVLWYRRSTLRGSLQVTGTIKTNLEELLACLALAVAVGDVGSNPRRIDNVEQGQVLDLAREFQQEGHGLPDATRGAHHGHLTQQSASTNAQERWDEGCQQKVLRKRSVA